MTDPEALDVIRSAWIAWATHQIEASEAMAQIAEALEQSGREVIGKADYPANEG